jgi:hypothetical protein
VTSGGASAALTAPTADGATSTTITVRVTAQDGTTTQDYTIAVTQDAPSPDATLKALDLSAGTLNPAFASGTLAYAAALPSGTASFAVTPTASEPHATIQVDQDGGGFAVVASGSASAALTAPAADGTTTSTVTVRITAQDGIATQDYVITVTRLAPPQDVLALFPLYADTVCVPTGDVSGEQTFAPGSAGMTVEVYKNGATAWTPATVWHDPTGATTTPVSTLLQRSQITGGSWPTDSDMNVDRWVQFAVSTSVSKILTVDTISFFAGSGGGANLRYRVWYSTRADFTGAVELSGMSWASSPPTPVKNDMYFRTATGQSIVVNAGDTLHLRIFPWQTGATSTKYLLLQSVTVHGTVQ